MRAVISIFVLCVLLVFVTQISATYIEGHETNKPKNRYKKNPIHIKEYFQLKTSIQGALNKMEDEKETMEDIWEKLFRVIFCMAGSAMGFLSYQLNTVVAVINSATGKYEHLPTATLPCTANKCFIPSNYLDPLPLAATYYDANQYCLSIGGKLAEPFLLENSALGSDIYRTFSGYLNAANNYWIRGEVNSGNPPQIVSGGGFVIPNDFFRYKSIHNFPSTPPAITSTSALTLAGPLNWDQRHWYIDSQPSINTYPYLCEFRVIYAPFQTDSINYFASMGQNQNIVDTRKNFISTYCLKAGALDASLRGNNNGQGDGQKLSIEELKKKLLSTKFSKLNLKDFAENELNINGKNKKQKLRSESFIKTFLPEHLWKFTKIDFAPTPQENVDQNIEKLKNPSVIPLVKSPINGTTDIPDKITGSSIHTENLSEKEENIAE